MSKAHASLQRFVLLAFCFAVSLLIACADESDHCSGSDCGIIRSDCDPACESGRSCILGQCVVNSASCEQAGEACLPGREQASGFVCMDWGGAKEISSICSTSCADGSQCPTGSLCYALHSAQDRSCAQNADCAEGKACFAGVCRFAACQPSQCSGPLSGQAECDAQFGGHPDYPNGARCVAAGNGAHFCEPAGSRQVGDDCVDGAEAAQTQNYPATCAPGLSCVNATCLKSCADDAGCEAPATCVFEEGASSAESGYCVNACTPFEEDACPAGQMCEPLGQGVGQCVPAGFKEAFSRCLPGEGECAAGTLCVEYPEAGAEARCQPICNLAPSSTDEDGSIAPGAQAARDATCPQPEAAEASLRLAHLADALGPVDIYLDNDAQPLAAGLGFEASFPASDASGDASWHSLPGGRYRLRALPAGAPRSDLPLAEFNIDLIAGQGKTALLGSAAPSASADAEFLALDAIAADARTPNIDYRLAHMVADLGAIDIVLLAASADASDISAHTLLGENLRRGDVQPSGDAPFELLDENIGKPLKLLAFPAGADRADAGAMLFESDAFTLDADVTLVLHGTMDTADNTPSQLISQVAMGPSAPTSAGGARFSCVELEGRSFGMCQQRCTGGASDYGQNICEGEQLGCAPIFLANRQQWTNLCAPVGPGAVDDACDPYRAQGDCAEGLYCQPVGSDEPAQSGLSGRCAALCALDAAPGSTGLGCGAGKSCQALEPAGTFEIGQCGWTCEPSSGYRDASCPAGLDRCEPSAVLSDDLSGQSAPGVMHPQPFCAAAGPRQPGENCQGNDCAAGSECLYPRSVQTDFTSTLASPYFGGAGLIPVCMAACDPFDGDSAAHVCPSGETCLFNAWNAEVGHCAPIVEELAPLQPCTQPGLACGEDSICALSQNTPTCFRFCDYLGADAQGGYLQSSCPADLRCEPLINDIGICQPS